MRDIASPPIGPNLGRNHQGELTGRGGYDVPFGIWKTKAGEAILFNRFRHPIYTQRPDGTVIPERPNRQVDGITDTLPFWPKDTKWSASTFARCNGILQRWREAARSGGPVSLKQLLGEK
jgi:hypothetical protein